MMFVCTATYHDKVHGNADGFRDAYETTDSADQALKWLREHQGRDDVYCAHVTISIASTDYDEPTLAEVTAALADFRAAGAGWDRV
jgi:hypothetical protein